MPSSALSRAGALRAEVRSYLDTDPQRALEALARLLAVEDDDGPSAAQAARAVGQLAQERYRAERERW